jgi:hypothetical protein
MLGSMIRGPFVATAELLRSPVDLIWANGPEVALHAVVGASGFVPIVILAVNYDPIERGHVSSLAQSGRAQQRAMPVIGSAHHDSQLISAVLFS